MFFRLAPFPWTVMCTLLITMSTSYGADLPPSVDDVKPYKKAMVGKTLSPEASEQELNSGPENPTPKDQAEPFSGTNPSSPKQDGVKDGLPAKEAKAAEDLKADPATLNALGNVVSEKDQTFGAVLKGWGKKVGDFYQTIEEYMGWDETTRLKKLDEGCRSNAALACFELAESSQRVGKAFEAETWYQLACSLQHSPSCARYKRLVGSRESYEARLRGERFEVESLCESGRAASCAKAAYIAKYFGERSISESLNLKSCDLGYPAGCLQVAERKGTKVILRQQKTLRKKDGRS